MTKKKTAVVKKETEALMTTNDFQADSDIGHDIVDSECFTIPLLKQAQALSPELKKTKSEYIEGLEEGDFFNSLTRENYGASLNVIPVAFEKQYLKWIPRNEGGGYRGAISMIEFQKLCSDGQIKMVDNMPKDESGLDYVDTRVHYIIVVTDKNNEFLAYPLSSTGIGASKSWYTRYQGIRFDGDTGPFKPPCFAQLWHLEKTDRTNDKGDWAGPQFTYKGALYNTQQHFRAYQLAKEMIETMNTQETALDYSEDEQVQEAKLY